MYERSLNEAERILASDKDVIVAVKKIWEAVEKQGKKQGFETPSLADFTALLEGDARFEFMPTLEDNGEPVEELPRDEGGQSEELESLGFYSGDRVKLRSVELTPEVIGGLIRRKVDLTMDALTKAWERRPEGDRDAEDQLLDILAKTQKLQREVKNTFSPEKMKDLQLALKKAERKPSIAKAKSSSPKKKLRASAKKVKSKRTPAPPRSNRKRRK